jgi:hypothetical protein
MENAPLSIIKDLIDMSQNEAVRIIQRLIQSDKLLAGPTASFEKDGTLILCQSPVTQKASIEKFRGKSERPVDLLGGRIMSLIFSTISVWNLHNYLESQDSCSTTHHNRWSCIKVDTFSIIVRMVVPSMLFTGVSLQMNNRQICLVSSISKGNCPEQEYFEAKITCCLLYPAAW